MTNNISLSYLRSRTFLIVAAILLSGLATFAVMNVLQKRPLEISFDLSSQPDGPIEVGSLSSDGRFEVLAQTVPIADSFAPCHYRFDVVAPESSGPIEMFFPGAPYSMAFDPPSAWANNGTYIIKTDPRKPARASFEGWHWGPSPQIVFTRDQSLGDVALMAGDTTRTLSLKSENTIQVDDDDALKIPVATDKRLYRFYASIKQKPDGALALRITGQNPFPAVYRLYMNLFVPAIYYAEETPPHVHTGRVFEQWTPTLEDSGTTVLLPPMPSTLWMAPVVWLGIFLTLVIGATVISALRSAALEPERLFVTRPLSKRFFWGCWIILFCAWMFFLVLFWPGTMNVDSLQQWKQARDFSFDTQHPVSYALFFWTVRQVWDSPAPIAIIQIALLSGILALGFSLLEQANVSRWILWPALLLTACSLKNTTMVISLIKDTPYAIVSVGLIVVLLHLLLKPADQKYLRFWVVAGLCLGLLPLLRHNGLLVTAGMAILLPVLFRSHRQKAFLCGILAIALWGVVAFALLPLLPTEKEKVGPKLALAHLAILLDRDVPLNNEEYAFLNSLRTIDDRWDYSVTRIESTVSPVGIKLNEDTIEQNKSRILHLYADLLLRNPLVAAQYFFERGQYLYVPWDITPIETYFLGISSNEFGLFNFSLVLDWPDAIRHFLRTTEKPQWNWLFWRPALPLYVCLLAMLMLFARRKPLFAIVLFAPLWLGTLSLFIVPVAQTARYQFCLTLPTALLFACVFLPNGQQAPPPANKDAATSKEQS